MNEAGSAPPPFSLEGDEVQLWVAALDQPASRLESWRGVLSADESARADRFVFARDRARFVVARGVLRALLARYLGAAPSRLVLAYGPRGKPGLAGAWADSALQFNVAHSHDIALYAFTRGRAIGVDVELVRPLEDMGQLARSVFARQELAVFLALPPHQQAGWFFHIWTRKEALLKATGDGLARPLEEVDVSSAPGDASASVSLPAPRPAASASRWMIRDVAAVPGYAAAVAVEEPLGRLACRRWE